MITVSSEAAKQIKYSATQSKMEGMPLRLAAKKAEDGSIQYLMGFDDQQKDEDLSFKSEGISIIVSPDSFVLLKNTELDFVVLDDGEKNFIFKNPNDPNYRSTETDSEHHL